MKRICESLEVARSNLYARPDKLTGARRSAQSDNELLALILRIIADHPSYGYRRVHALCKYKLVESVNHKRIYRVMRQNNLLLSHQEKRQETRQHKGTVATAKSDQRWCGDGFELSCENGERVRVIFALDCCDREVMAYAASTGGYTAQMAQDVMLASVEARFGQTHAAHEVEWLTDNGACFTARETKEMSRELGLKSCFTPIRSPQSNGMAEAFVKTIKRDYAAFARLSDAECVIKLLSGWISDYNENAPHKGLGMLSPRQYRKLRSACLEISPEPRVS